MSVFFDAQTAGRRGSHRGGHLYIQANEIHNAITYYRRSHDGTIAEGERIPAGGAGSGYSSPSADRVQPRIQARGGEAGEGSGGVAVAQAAGNFDLHENVLRKWIREASADPEHAFPGHGQMRPEQFKINRLHKEVTNLKALLQPSATTLAACSGRRSPIQIQSVVSGIAGFDVHLTPGRG